MVALSTSGNSKNVVNALKAAKEAGLLTVGFSGESTGAIDEYCDYKVKIPSDDTPRIQEAHMLLGHIICELAEKNIFA